MNRTHAEARRRFTEVVRDNVPNIHLPKSEFTFERILLSCRGEYVVSQVTELPWTAEGSRYGRGMDVGTNVEVRTGESWNRDLKVYPKEANKREVVLAVRIEENLYAIVGWILASDAKRFPIEERRGLKGSHFVPRKALHKIETLPSAPVDTPYWRQAAERRRRWNARESARDAAGSVSQSRSSISTPQPADRPALPKNTVPTF